MLPARRDSQPVPQGILAHGASASAISSADSAAACVQAVMGERQQRGGDIEYHRGRRGARQQGRIAVLDVVEEIEGVVHDLGGGGRGEGRAPVPPTATQQHSGRSAHGVRRPPSTRVGSERTSLTTSARARGHGAAAIAARRDVLHGV